jgi:hypothetical protein
VYLFKTVLKNCVINDKVLEITLPENLGYIAIDDFIYRNIYLKRPKCWQKLILQLLLLVDR